MSEYLEVLFTRHRDVVINCDYMSEGNVILELEGGKYEVSLSPPPNFTLAQHHIDLHNTSTITPVQIN